MPPCLKGSSSKKRAQNFQEVLHDCSYTGPCSDSAPKSSPLRGSLSLTQNGVTKEGSLRKFSSFLPHRLIWKHSSAFLPCLERIRATACTSGWVGSTSVRAAAGCADQPQALACSSCGAKAGGCIQRKAPFPPPHQPGPSACEDPVLTQSLSSQTQKFEPGRRHRNIQLSVPVLPALLLSLQAHLGETLFPQEIFTQEFSPALSPPPSPEE